METYLFGLLIILVVILIGLVYFMSKQFRDNDTKLKINIKDLEALRNKVLELDNILHSQMHQQPHINFNNGMFGEEKVDLDTDFDIVENSELVNESNSDESVDVDEVNLEEEEEEEPDAVHEEVTDEVNFEEDEEEEPDAVPEEVTDEVNLEEDEEEVTDVVPEEVTDEVNLEADEEEVTDAVPEENVSTSEETENETEIEEVTDKVETLLGVSKKIKFKQPSSKAKKFDVGHRIESEHDGQTYEVVLNSRNRPRWKRISQ